MQLFKCMHLKTKIELQSYLLVYLNTIDDWQKINKSIYDQKKRSTKSSKQKFNRISVNIYERIETTFAVKCIVSIGYYMRLRVAIGCYAYCSIQCSHRFHEQ